MAKEIDRQYNGQKTEKSRTLVNIIFDLLQKHLETALAFKYLLFKDKKREMVVPLVLFRISDTDENILKTMSR